jgi:YHS domain-containing protein
MLALFWAVMATAGLITEGIFGALGAIPTTRPTTVAPAHFQWNYTTYLNIIFLALFGLLYWTYRNRERLGGGSGHALDPVCGMQVQTANAPASVIHESHRVYFCSDHCRHRFEADPAKFAKVPVAAGTHDHAAMGGPTEMSHTPAVSVVDSSHSSSHVDPVCGMTVDPAKATVHAVHGDHEVYFCGEACKEAFMSDPGSSRIDVRP